MSAVVIMSDVNPALAILGRLRDYCYCRNKVKCRLVSHRFVTMGRTMTRPVEGEDVEDLRGIGTSVLH